MVLNLCETGFLNCSQIIGQAISATTQDTTGSLFLTFLFIMLFLVVVCMMFNIQIEYTMIIVLPVGLSLMAYFKEFIGIGSVILIYLSILITKNFILK